MTTAHSPNTCDHPGVWKRSKVDPLVSARDISIQLLTAELGFVYNEVHASLDRAQSFLKWTFTLYGVLLGACLAAQSFISGSQPNAVLANAIWLVVAWGLPAIVWAGVIAWLGENDRMVRAARYLAGIEVRIGRLPELREAIGFRPLRWQSWIFGATNARWNWLRAFTYMAIAGAFVVAAATSHLLEWNWGQSLVAHKEAAFSFEAITWVSLGISLAGLLTALAIGARIWFLHRSSRIEDGFD